MDKEEVQKTQFFDARLANLEYTQILVSRDFLNDLSQLIELTQPLITKQALFRLGQNSDGGYVLSPEFQSRLCLNLGVGYEVTADLDLISRGFKLYAFDGTVPNPLPGEAAYSFIQKNIGYTKGDDGITNLANIFSEHPELNEVDLILLDIEGHEHEVLKNELNYVVKANQVVVEFHGLDLLGDHQFAAGLIKILKKLSKTHSPIHVHANNSGGAIHLGSASWPTILEVTFLKHEFCTSELNYGPYPTPIDFPNVDVRPDMDLNPFYGQNKSYAPLTRTILGLS